MKNRLLTTVSIATLLLLAEGLWVYALMPHPADASRNAAGTYALPAGNPVVTGTSISSTWANNTLADLSTEMSDSKSRSGKGDFTAPVRGADGSVSSPTWSWTNDTGSGEYRIGSGDFGWAISGVKKLELTSSLFTVTPDATFSGKLGIGAAPSWPLDVETTTGFVHAKFAASGTVPLFIFTGPGQSNVGFNLRHDGTNLKYETTNTGATIQYFPTNSAVAFFTAPSGTAGNTATATERARVDINGLTIGGGTAISAVSAGTCTLNNGNPTSTCTATVVSGAKCLATIVTATPGTSNPVATSVSGTTMTALVAVSNLTNVVNYWCFL